MKTKTILMATTGLLLLGACSTLQSDEKTAKDSPPSMSKSEMSKSEQPEMKKDSPPSMDPN